MSFDAIKGFVGLVLAGVIGFTGGAAAATDPPTEMPPVDFRGEAASVDAHFAADRVSRSGDNHGLPFAIVDKKFARLFVFDRDSRLVGASAALIGAARGDEVGRAQGLRDLASLRVADRTTPAGRFASEPGHNHRGEPIVWVDYGASLAIHRLRPAPLREHRPERLASQSVDDKRISLGCVVVPVAFYEGVVAPLLGHGRGVVYVLPESRPVETLFDAEGDRIASR